MRPAPPPPWLPALALLLTGALCGGAAGSAAAAAADSAPLRVVCANTILADIVHQLGGDRVVSVSLIPPGVDPHSWEPAPADLAQLTGARLVVVNGLGLEGWLAHALAAAGSSVPVVVASAGVTVLSGPGGEGAGGADPHAWQDAGNAMLYARAIRDALIAADPSGSEDYAAWAEAYLGELRVVDAWIRQQIARLPAGHRLLVTSHDALGYYTRAYGLELRTVEGAAPGQEPDAAHISELIALIRARQLPAVFIEDAGNAKVIARIAGDGGAVLGGRLYSDSLAAPGAQAGTYLGMLLANTRTIVRALR